MNSLRAAFGTQQREISNEWEENPLRATSPELGRLSPRRRNEAGMRKSVYCQ